MNNTQTNYTISESVVLPSKGLIYDKLLNSNIELRSMTARDEMKRSAQTTTPLKTLSDIIEGCMIEKPAIHVYDMALGDYEFLLHKLRIVTYGPDYGISMKCPYCGENIDATTNLDDQEVKEFDEAIFRELQTFELPKSRATVTIKFTTPHLLDEIEAKTKEMKRKYKEAQVDFEQLVTLTLLIDSVNGEQLNSVELEKFINNLPAADMIKIMNNSAKLNQCVGLDNKLYVSCPECGNEIQTFFRFGLEFFRPSNI